MSKQIQDAYIVAATRTPVGKAPKGMFRNTRPDDMLAHVLRSVVAQAPGIDLSRIDDAIIGCAMPEGEQGMNVARIGLLLAGLPNTIAAQTINRFCSSGLQAVAMAADQIRLGNADLMLAGGTATLPGLKDRVTDLTGFASNIVNPFDQMQLGGAVREARVRREAPSYLTACGLAMRRFVQ